MKTNKMEHFVCGVLATYGLVVACGNMKESKLENDTTEDEPEDSAGDGSASGILKNRISESGKGPVSRLRGKKGKNGKFEKNVRRKKSNKGCPCL